MAKAAKSKSKAKPAKKSPARSKPNPLSRPFRFVGIWAARAAIFLGVLILVLVVLFSVVNPPTTHTILSESRRLGGVERTWIPLEDIAPVMARSVVAAEDANFCLHWGIDVSAVRAAFEAGGTRGGSTISQQVVKNVFLWQDRSWIRKALETVITPVVELVWSKRRIIEVYLNVAEMGNGVFGVGAAAQTYFKVAPDKLTAQQAALLAAVLPSPKKRSPKKPSSRTRKRAAAIMDGAATIRADGRADCFED